MDMAQEYYSEHFLSINRASQHKSGFVYIGVVMLEVLLVGFCLFESTVHDLGPMKSTEHIYKSSLVHEKFTFWSSLSKNNSNKQDCI